MCRVLSTFADVHGAEHGAVDSAALGPGLSHRSPPRSAADNRRKMSAASDKTHPYSLRRARPVSPTSSFGRFGARPWPW